jgi:hypothetical protein
MKNWTRKEFIRNSLVGGGAAFLAGNGRLYGQVGGTGSANGDVRVAVVGVRAQGPGPKKD